MNGSYFFIATFVVIFGQILFCQNTEAAEFNPSNFAHKYLERYGYVEHPTAKDGEPAALVNWKGSLMSMQAFLGIPQTGILDEETIRTMNMSRCGNPDKEKGNHKRSKRYTTKGFWGKRNITYRILNHTPKLTQAASFEAIRRAFGIWSRHVDLQFTEKTGKKEADIEIKFVPGEHGDGSAFDGPGGYLAHAFYPSEDLGGDTHFDSSENWVYNAKSDVGNDLFLVAVHELGHALGLGHSNDVRAIMAPIYRYHNLTNFDISEDDISGIQSIYRKKPKINYPKPPRTEKRTTTTRPTRYPPRRTSTLPPRRKPTTTTKTPFPQLCELPAYDAIAYIRGELYVFSGKYFWRKEKRLNRFVGPYEISLFWGEIKGRVSAVYEDQETNRIRFFQDQKYYEYDATTLERGPKHLSDLGLKNNDINAAFWWKNTKKTYLFRGDWFWQLSTSGRLRVDNDYPQHRQTKFNNVPSDFHAAFSDNNRNSKDRFTYFVKGTEYYTFDNQLSTVVEGPNSFRADWLDCSVARASSEDVNITAIVAATITVAVLIIIVLGLILWQRRRSNGPIKSSMLMTGPYSSGWQRHIDGMNVYVTAAQQKMRLMKFNLQGQV